MIKNTGWRRVGACALALGLCSSVGVMAAAADTTGGGDKPSKATCVEPALSLLTVQRLGPATYQVSLRDPGTVTCSDFTLNVGSYRIPDTWDRNGWNPTALPQHEFDYAALTFGAGGTDPVSVTVGVPECGPFQTDIYTGPRLPLLEWPSPMAGARVLGTMRDQAACSQPPTPATSNPPPSPATDSPAPPAAGQTSSAPAAVAPTASGSPTRVQAPAATKTASAAAAPQRDVAVLGTRTGTLPHTGGSAHTGQLLLLATGLVTAGGLLVTLASNGARGLAALRRH